MTKRKIFLGMAAAWIGAGVFLSARPVKNPDTAVLVLGAYTAPREAYRDIIPLFQDHWKKKTGQEVQVRESYLGSGAQSRAIAGGFEADIAALSLEADITRLVKAGLVTHDWKAKPHRGMVSTSLVVFAVPRGNAKRIKDWADLARPGLSLLMPNPKVSGGAQWNFLAVYGAAQRGQVPGFSSDEAGARSFARAVLQNVSAMDKGARESLITFERGIGDAAITYENEVLLGRRAGLTYERVIPRSTILVENPVAVVDAYADKHGVRDAAEAFVAFLWTLEAQRVFAENGFRPMDPAVARQFRDRYPPVQDLWTVEALGGWNRAGPDFFGPSGIYDQVLEGVYAAR
jgi:sulfate/thiosulfate transport system substrate-binding protein